MMLAVCPNCRTVHEAVGPAALTGLDEADTSTRLHCKLCELPSSYLVPLEDAPATRHGEFGYPRAVVPTFDGSFAEWWLVEPNLLDACARGGARAGLARQLADEMRVPRELVSRWIGPRTQEIPGVPSDKSLDATQARRLVGIARLIGQAETMLKTSGDDARLEAARWIAAWLETPQAVLGGALPSEYLSNREHLQLVSDLLARTQPGVDV